MNYRKFSKIAIGLLILTMAFSVAAQTKAKTSKKKTPPKPAVTKPTPVIETEPVKEPEVKKNARPEAEIPVISDSKNIETNKKNSRSTTATVESKPVYFYEFSKPEFVVSKILIEHDENGKGKITLQKKDFSEPETDPIQLSAVSLERVKAAWSQLNFLDSTENYQYVKDYSHLGTMKFTMRKDGRERTATFNYTDNKDAKTLADEYRKIGQQFVWIFDINVALENQPLDAPGVIYSLDTLVKRNEISDPVQLIPRLKALGNDERIPLIARNRAIKLAEAIEKQEKKKEDK